MRVRDALFATSLDANKSCSGWKVRPESTFRGMLLQSVRIAPMLIVASGPVAADNTSFPILFIGNTFGEMNVYGGRSRHYTDNPSRSRYASFSVRAPAEYCTVTACLTFNRAKSASANFPGSVVLTQNSGGVR